MNTSRKKFLLPQSLREVEVGFLFPYNPRNAATNYSRVESDVTLSNVPCNLGNTSHPLTDDYMIAFIQIITHWDFNDSLTTRCVSNV